MNATISLDGLLSFIRSLALSPDNKEWLAQKLIEDARHEQDAAPCQYNAEQLQQRLNNLCRAIAKDTTAPATNCANDTPHANSLDNPSPAKHVIIHN